MNRMQPGLPQSEVEAALARTASILSAALESTADGILVVDLDGKITRYNQRLLAMWDLSPDAMKGHAEIALLAAAEQLEDPELFISRARERAADTTSESLDMVWLKDGRIFERYTQPQRLDGNVIGRVWSFRDVTEREHVLLWTTFLSEASYLLSSLDIERAMVAVADLAVRSVADACAIDVLSGSTGPRRLRSAVRPGAAEVPSRLSRAVLGGSAVIQSTSRGSRIITPVGSHGSLHGVISFARERKRAPYVDADLVYVSELARRACLAVENAQLFQTASEALHTRDEFLSVAAHEIRGPLTVMRLAAQQLERTERMPDAARRPLSVIVRQDRRLARFVDDLLEATALRVGLPSLRLSEVDLGEIIREVVAQLGPELASSGSALSLSIEGSIVGIWDESKVLQIVNKLLSNAIKFGLAKPIDVTASSHDGIVTMTVTDHGIGIPESRIPLIFDPFERAVSARQYGGLGLGLYVVRELVRALGGSVTVASKEHEWSAFTITLPQSRTP